MAAIKNTTIINGTWSTTIEVGYSKLNLNLEGEMLHEIEEDWRVIENSTTLIKLRHVRGGGKTDYLNFTKN